MGLEKLRADFAMHRGHEMIVDREAGITREQLDEVEIRMLQGQRIPRLLPVEWIDIDGQVTFHYSLEGKRMLSHKLQSQQLGMIDFYALLLAVVEAIDDSRHFMLRPIGFILHEQYIFIGEQWLDIGIPYLPLRGEGAVESAEEAVLAMAVRWIGYIAQPDGTGLQHVFQHLKGGHVDWNALRQSLITLISGVHTGGNAAGSSAASGQSLSRTDEWHSAEKEERGSAGAGAQRSALQSVSRWPRSSESGRGAVPRIDEMRSAADIRAASEAEAAGAGHASAAVPESAKSGGRSAAVLPFIKPGASKDRPEKETESRVELAGDPEGGPPLNELDSEQAESARSRKKWLLIGVFVIASALIWRYLYLASPGGSNLLISIGLTATAGAAAILYWRRSAQPEDDAEHEWLQKGKWNEEEDEWKPSSSQLSHHSSEQEEVRRNGLFAQFQEGENRIEAVRMTSGDHYPTYSEPAFHAPTAQAGRPASGAARQEVTVLLGDKPGGQTPGMRRKPWLERSAGGQTDRIELGSDVLVIGRSPEGAQFVDESEGISRSHIELSPGDQGWTVKDIGSRNGSSFNGETMIPYKAYELQDGDMLQLAGDKGPKYTFRCP